MDGALGALDLVTGRIYLIFRFKGGTLLSLVGTDYFLKCGRNIISTLSGDGFFTCYERSYQVLCLLHAGSRTFD